MLAFGQLYALGVEFGEDISFPLDIIGKKKSLYCGWFVVVRISGALAVVWLTEAGDFGVGGTAYDTVDVVD